ncbi:MAG: heparan-alpha-glucosaminide N-acetyltransferase [Spirochaetota bacterium]
MNTAVYIVKKALNIQHRKGRYWEIDAFRGFAIVLMVFYHFVWDLYYFRFADIDMLTGFWQVFARVIASLFLFTSGVSVAIGYQRSEVRKNHSFKRVLARAGIIFGWALVISAVSFVQFGKQGGIVFGILHLLAVGIVIGYGVAMLPNILVFLLVPAVSVLGWFLYFHVFSHDPWYIWLGIRQYGRLMYDYYPVFPWIASVLFGVFCGKLLFKDGKPVYTLPDLGGVFPFHTLALMGRYSLPIYLVHQPVLIAGFTLVVMLLQ